MFNMFNKYFLAAFSELFRKPLRKPSYDDAGVWAGGGEPYAAMHYWN